MDRRYFFITTPEENVVNALTIRLGDNVDQTTSIDGSVVFIKTTEDLIASKISGGMSINTLFPPAFTQEMTYEEAKTRLRSIEFQEEET
jgi:hypothetical protein